MADRIGTYYGYVESMMVASGSWDKHEVEQQVDQQARRHAASSGRPVEVRIGVVDKDETTERGTRRTTLERYSVAPDGTRGESNGRKFGGKTS